ncbi:MAG: N-6 DNA methylase [Caldilineaceae bacterium]|nr:N-6 DNA methylase [Caldilineaceae bacterium]
MADNILQYESTIWNTADLLRGCGIKESEWPAYMMPFFALAMIESRLLRSLDELKTQEGITDFADVNPDDLAGVVRDRVKAYNTYLVEQGKTLRSISQNDKSFELDFEAYLAAFDSETRWLLGVNAGDGEKFLDMRGVINRLKAKKVLFSYAKEWSQIDLKPFNNSEITTLEEHIKRRWADISAETAGEQYTPDDVIDLIAELIIAKVAPTGGVLIVYDGTCGGGNLLFGVEDRIKAKTNRVTQTYGQDWNDALFALARIESRFRDDSHIEHGNTLTEDKFSHIEAQVVVANPPYGVSWKGYQKEIVNDKTLRFKHLPSIADGQLLFTQHLIDKLDDDGFGVIVHNGSTLFSGDAGSGESNVRKWMLDADIVEAVVQLPTDEFFNTGIHTYLWVLNRAKDAARKDKVMLIDASQKFRPLKKNKGAKRREVDERSRQSIVAALATFEDNDFARVFDRAFFYYNKQAIQLTNVDAAGHSFAEQLKDEQKSLKLHPVKISTPASALAEFPVTSFDPNRYTSLLDRYEREIAPFVAGLDYKERALVVETKKERYWYDAERETLVKEAAGQQAALGCGRIVVKAAYKAAGKSQPARVEVTVELTPDYEKDYEIIPYHRKVEANQQAIDAFMAKYITRPFAYLDNVVGVEINFNKVFYQPEQLRDVATILTEIAAIDAELQTMEAALVL